VKTVVPDALGVALCFVVASAASAQSYVCAWGRVCFDSRAMDTPCVKVVAAGYNTCTLHADGAIYMQGASGPERHGVVPPPPPGRRYVDMHFGSFGLGLLDDGNLVGWGTMPGTLAYGVIPIPPLPPGLRYTRMAAGLHGIAERSDGSFVTWGPNQFGQGNLPALPPGTTVTQFDAMVNHSAMLLSDGSLVMWGANTYGQCNVPPLPPGVRYQFFELGPRHTLALRSDGEIVAFGNNTSGECNVPPLPAGVRYVTCSAGGMSHSYFSVAARSDGALVAWGNNGLGQCNVPALPAGIRCRQLAAGGYHGLALLADGTLMTWGDSLNYPTGVPALPSGGSGPAVRFADASLGLFHTVVAQTDGAIRAFGEDNIGLLNVPALSPSDRAVKVRADAHHSAAVLRDGRIIAWEINGGGQCNVPSLPRGTTYFDVVLGPGHTVALRSDGEALAFGWPTLSQTTIPLRPPGVSFVAADAHYGKNFLVQSDGNIAVSGAATGAVPPPPPPAGLRYVAVATGSSMDANVALRSDGEAILWNHAGGPTLIWSPVPPLPFGVVYVEVSGRATHFVLRRSDGQVTMCGNVGDNYEFVSFVPPLAPGTSYVQVSSYADVSLGRVGPTTTYVSFAQGCAGSRPPTRLVPRETPRIGRNLQVTLFDLPANVALLAMGFQRTSPLSLASLGMPGCDLHISVDATAGLSGQQNQAQWSLPIPDLPSLVGLRFYNQALVLDPNAGNGLGAVLSDAAEGVIGYP